MVVADGDQHLWVSGVEGDSIDDVLVGQAGEADPIVSFPDVAMLVLRTTGKVLVSVVGRVLLFHTIFTFVKSNFLRFMLYHFLLFISFLKFILNYFYVYIIFHTLSEPFLDLF